MKHDVQRDLIHRVFDYADRRTTTLAPESFLEDVAAYTDPSRLARERLRLFRGEPLLLAFSGQLAAAGDWLSHDLSGLPILLVRGADGRVRAFANACRHRGAPVAKGCGRSARVFTCPYHGWSWDTEGRLTGLPFAEGFADLPEERRRLVSLPVAERHGLVLVRPSPGGALDADAWLGPLGPELGDFGYARHVPYAVRSLECRLNWKLAIDTFLESYHVPVLHKDSVGPIFVGNLAPYDAFGRHGRLVAVRRKLLALRERPESEWDLIPNSGLLYLLFPNSILIQQADHVELWQAWPAGDEPGRSHVTLSFLIPEPPANAAATRHWEANLELAVRTVTQEDFPLGESIQRGFESAAQPRVVFGRNEPGLIHYHRNLREAVARA